ncbi:MAG: PfkB family carbohydrate kinase [Peptostreptococcaceae bacterium]
MSNILCIGEIMQRLSVSFGKTLTDVDEYKVDYGGCEANIAVQLSNLNNKVHFYTVLPQNDLSMPVEKLLLKYKVDTSKIDYSEGRLGTYYLENGQGLKAPKVIYDRQYSAFSLINEESYNLDQILENIEYIVMSGINFGISENTRKFGFDVLKYAKEKGIKIFFDFNYRSKLWSIEEASKTIREVIGYVDYISCGILDAKNILGIKNDNKELDYEGQLNYYYEKIKEDYPNIKSIFSTNRNVINSSHHTIVGYYYDNQLFKSKKYDIENIVDRVGSGDYFMSGIIDGVIKNKDSQSIVDYATPLCALKHYILGDNGYISDDMVSNAINNSQIIKR